MGKRRILVKKHKIPVKEVRLRNGGSPYQEKRPGHPVDPQGPSGLPYCQLRGSGRNLGKPVGIMRKKRRFEYHSLVASVLVCDSRGAQPGILSSFEEAPKLDQCITVEDDIRIGHTNVFAGCGSHPAVDRAPVADVSSGLHIVNFRTRLQEFLGTVPGVIVHHSKAKREWDIEEVKESA